MNSPKAYFSDIKNAEIREQSEPNLTSCRGLHDGLTTSGSEELSLWTSLLFAEMIYRRRLKV